MDTPRKIKEQIMRRTAFLRERAKMTQDEIADALGIGRNKYVKYEKIYDDRATTIPVYLIPKFCILTSCSVDFLLTGRENPVLEAYNRLDPDSKERLAVDQFLQIDDQPSAAAPSEPVTKKAVL